MVRSLGSAKAGRKRYPTDIETVLLAAPDSFAASRYASAPPDTGSQNSRFGLRQLGSVSAALTAPVLRYECLRQV
jgi:hypothetical protein